MFCKLYSVLYLVSWALTVNGQQIIKYNGAEMWRSYTNSTQQIVTILGLAHAMDISIWKLTTTKADFMVKCDKIEQVGKHLNANGVSYRVLIKDVQAMIEAQPNILAKWDQMSLRVGHRLTWKDYPTMTFINEYYQYIEQYYDYICKISNIGHTSKNWPIKLVTISNGNANNTKILITAGVHAREWTSITSALYLIQAIVSKFKKLPKHIQNKDWYIIPMLNPDGFDYTHSYDRLWRKNRRAFKSCVGVDINRNFGENWFINGITETDDCSEAYSGPKAFSEAESITLKNLVSSLKTKPKLYLDIHSYGQMILYPWTSKQIKTVDRQLHENAAKGMIESIKKRNGRTYTAGPAYQTIYPATGSSIDWAYASGITYTYAMEVNDESHGFLAPKSSIKECGDDILIAANYLAEII